MKLLYRIYRILLFVYPRKFRSDFAREMVDTLREHEAEVREREKPFSLPRFWLRELVAVIRTGLGLRLEKRRNSRSPNRPRRPRRWYRSATDTLLQDIRFAFRNLRKRPVFTAVVVATLGVGIGATTAMFGTINATLLSSLHFDEPDRLVMGRATFDGRINPYVSGYDYYDYRDQNESFESLAALLPRVSRFTILGRAEPERVDCEFITWDLFPTLRVSPALGRMFTEEEGVGGGPNVVMISYGYWQRRFGGSPDVLAARSSWTVLCTRSSASCPTVSTS